MVRVVGLTCWVLFIATFVITTRADDWPQWRGPQRDGEWRETNTVDHFDAKQLEPVWSVPIGPGYSGPTVAAGRVYVTDRQTDPKQIERVHCFDEATGKSIWSHVYDCTYDGVGYEAGPRACVTIADGRAFALGAMGHLHALDAATGQVLWMVDLLKQYAFEMPIWGIAAAPLVYDNLVIVQCGGKPDACLVAFDVRSGKEVWRALSDRASYSAPIIVQQAQRDVLVAWTGDQIVGIEPRTGALHWHIAFPPEKMVIAVATPVHHQGHLLVTSFYDGSRLLRLDPNELKAEEVWSRKGASEQQTDALHSIMSTPLIIDDHIYGVDSYGELRCLNLLTGDRVWESDKATPHARWSNIHFVKQGSLVWMFNESGELIISQLSPAGFVEKSRAKIIDPTVHQLNRRGQGVCWSHPAFANRHIFVRNDQELRRVSLETPTPTAQSR